MLVLQSNFHNPVSEILVLFLVVDYILVSWDHHVVLVKYYEDFLYLFIQSLLKSLPLLLPYCLQFVEYKVESRLQFFAEESPVIPHALDSISIEPILSHVHNSEGYIDTTLSLVSQLVEMTDMLGKFRYVVCIADCINKVYPHISFGPNDLLYFCQSCFRKRLIRCFEELVIVCHPIQQERLAFSSLTGNDDSLRFS